MSLPLECIQNNYLVRDRLTVDAEEMTALKASIAARGHQTPVEVVALEAGRYGLISGWRRMRALTELLAETGEARFSAVLVLQRQSKDAAETYLAMVEENEIRVGLSYYERARIVSKAVEKGVYETQKKALNILFGTASRAKRSKIKTFIPIAETLDPVLRFPSALTERSGLVLGRALQEESGLADGSGGIVALRGGGLQAITVEADGFLTAETIRVGLAVRRAEASDIVSTVHEGRQLSMVSYGWEDRVALLETMPDGSAAS